ncbi:MAG TPA: helix-turn-helix domain-containing protein [Mycobacteriales bacterium]|jgi:excisionase family DNA binding protein|nr:helix-turn-helix domain-containing protein [Pseudonocardia sp.]HWH28361.1 helix-turn-helix domain-containing protein [Mycobacteriales bacterium]
MNAPDPTMNGQFPGHALLTVAEVARVMRVSKMTVYRLIQAEELPAVRFGRSIRVPAPAVRAYLTLDADG